MSLFLLGFMSLTPAAAHAHLGHIHEAQAAEEANVDSVPKNEATSGAQIQEAKAETATNAKIDSFDLFWPIAAGKTRGDRFYFLKLAKEKVRGALIFGDAKDADYHLFLATKRVVEAEKLLGENKLDEAKDTLQDALEHIEEASEEWSDVENTDTPVKHEINNKLNNLETFLPYLSTLTDDASTETLVKDLIEKVVSLNAAV